MCRPDDICLDTLHLEEICLDSLRLYEMRCVRMANARTLRALKADALACFVRTTFALTLCVRKIFALTVSI